MVGLVTCGLLATPAVSAADDDDARRAREAVRAGRLVPLETILAWLSERYHGRILEVELEIDDDDDPPSYEVEWLTPGGHVIEFEFDARDGTLLEREGRGLEEARRR